MATELQIRAQLDTMRSLPPRLERLASSLGTVEWPGQARRLNFPSGMELTAAERAETEALLGDLTRITTGGNLTEAQCSKARLSLLTKLLLGYPAAGGASDAAATARLDFYREAVADIAPWALDAAIRRWVRGDVAGLGAVNVDFAPSPGTLRRLCDLELAPFTAQIVKLRRLLSAVPIDRAMDPTPLPAPPSTAMGALPPQPKLRLM